MPAVIKRERRLPSELAFVRRQAYPFCRADLNVVDGWLKGRLDCKLCTGKQSVRKARQVLKLAAKAVLMCLV